MTIYTKKGDKGETSTLKKASKKISKDSLIVEALGSLDELNSFLGIARSFCENKSRNKFIKEIQNNLFIICSIIAGGELKFNKSKITKFEKEIDKIDANLPKLKSFLFSSGNLEATHLMYSRSLARRAERRVVALSKEEKINKNILQYLNRLSDMLFMLFREANFEAGLKEENWTTS